MKRQKRCKNCGWTGYLSDMNKVKDEQESKDKGHEVLVYVCPECGNNEMYFYVEEKDD